MTADAHSLSKLSLFYFWGAVGALAGFFLRLLMARTLTPLEYGAFYAIINFLLFLNIFNDFGLDGAFLFHYAKRRSEKEKRTVFSFYLFVKIGLALFIGAAIIIGNQWLASSYFHNVSLSRPLLALSCYFFFVSLAAIVTQYFAATGKLAYYAAMGNIRILLSFLFCLVAYFVIPGANLLTAYFIAWIASTALPTLLFVFHVPFPQLTIFRFAKRTVSEVFKYASFTLLSAAGGILLTTMDGIFITYFRSLTEVGLYQAALPIASLFLVFVDPLIAFLAPVVVERHHAGAHQDISAILSSIYKFGVFLLVPFTLFFVIFSREILLVLFGPDYVLAAPALVLLSFALFFRALQSINFAFLYGTGRIKVQFTIMWICVALNVLLDFLFVPRWGFVAAAAATLVSFLLMFLISFFVLKRHFTFASSWFRNLVKILVLAGLSLLLIAFLKSLLSLSLYFAAALIGCLFLIFYFGIGIFILKIVEWQELLSLLRQLISLLRGKLAAVTHR